MVYPCCQLLARCLQRSCYTDWRSFLNNYSQNLNVASVLAGQLLTWYLLSENCRKKLLNNKGLFTLGSWISLKPLTLSTGGCLGSSSKLMAVPESFINMIRQFHDGMTGRVSIGGDISDAFSINHGVKQGCVLAPTLFTLCLGAVLETMSANLASGVYIWTCSDGKLFNFAHLEAETRTNTLCVRDLLYADDIALVATNTMIFRI